MSEDSIPDFSKKARAGINRFFDEGFTRWPKNKLSVLFDNRPLETEEIQAILTSWEKSGFIRLRKNTDVYFEVLKQIE